MGGYLNEAMRAAFGAHPHVGEMRGEGMLCAVELVAERERRQFFAPAQGIGARVVAAVAGAITEVLG